MNENTSTMFFLLYVLTALLVFAGWVMNIFKLVQMGEGTWMTVFRVIGVVCAPLGAVLGWFF